MNLLKLLSAFFFPPKPEPKPESRLVHITKYERVDYKPEDAWVSITTFCGINSCYAESKGPSILISWYTRDVTCPMCKIESAKPNMSSYPPEIRELVNKRPWHRRIP
jgi:hypothetical protein